jgi:hypothetical protein
MELLDFVSLIERYGPERQGAGEWPAARRLLAALCCRPVDRLPVCLPGFDLFRWADASYSELLPAIARFTDPIHEVAWGYDAMAGLVQTEAREARLANGDLIRKVNTPRGYLTEVLRPSFHADGSTHQARVCWWIQDADDIRRFLSAPWQPTSRETQEMHTICTRLGDRALTIIDVYEPIQCVHDLMGAETLCLLSATEPSLIQKLTEAIFERVMEDLRYLLSQGIGPVFRVGGSEMAIPPLMSLRRYEQFCFPHERTMADAIHAAGQKMLLHCHGNINQLLERFIDAGADGVDPCEPPPVGGINLADAKHRVQGRLSLWGNLEYDVLSEASETDIQQVVRRAIEDGAPGDGFVLLPSCRLYQAPLPEQTQRNLFAVIAVAREYRA